MHWLKAASTPGILHPVEATLDAPVFYTGTTPPSRVERILCDRLYADVVLSVFDEWCERYEFALAEIGVYNHRYARHSDGSAIHPPRLSNHAFGLAMDWRGVYETQGAGQFISIAELQEQAPAKMIEIQHELTHAIRAAGRHPEILIEGGSGHWMHTGIWRPR